MQNARAELTPAEWELMECLWRRKTARSGELAQDMAQKTGWSRSTTLTLLRRMTDKGAVTAQPDGGANLYAPAIPREQAARRETSSLIDRVYNGSLSLLVSSMTKKRDLPPEELAALREILRGLEEEEK